MSSVRGDSYLRADQLGKVTAVEAPSAVPHDAVVELNKVADLPADNVVVDLVDDGVVVHLPVSPPIEPHADRIFLDPTSGLLGATKLQLAIKSLVDLMGALLGLALLLPVFLVIALTVKLTSPGPILFRGTRVGQDGEEFEFLKFRSMRVGADEEKVDLLDLNEALGPIFKMKNDPRMTTVGRLLRKSSLDELPQLLHVLSGRMSLVGFRPPIPKEVAEYTDYESQRLLIKPGLTCIWQVSGRSDLDFDTWIQMDLEYIANWSLLLDLKLLAKTFGAVVSGRGAY